MSNGLGADLTCLIIFNEINLACNTYNQPLIDLISQRLKKKRFLCAPDKSTNPS